jgi:hypothetical protein
MMNTFRDMLTKSATSSEGAMMDYMFHEVFCYIRREGKRNPDLALGRSKTHFMGGILDF